MNYLEKLAVKFIIWRIRKGWGADCEEEDPDWHTPGGCSSCQAKHTIEFLERHLDML